MSRPTEMLRTAPDHPADAVGRAVRAFTDEAERLELVDVAWSSVDTPVGLLVLAATEAGLVCVSYGGVDETLADLAARISPRVLESPGRLDGIRRQLGEYFEGGRRRFEVSVDWALSHGFRRRVLHELAEVPYGRTVSYRALAERAGSPNAFRAVGSAMATNPLPIVLPCHRVVRADGGLGGYGGGLQAKRRLLSLEGVDLPEG